MRLKQYNRALAIDYAQKWAYLRNPKYYDFDQLGGDCTNFISQCIYAGSKVMNYNKNNGWYYLNGNNKSPSWTGVEFLYQFLTNNKGNGPYGKEILQNQIELGDIIQLSFDGIKFGHTLIVVEIEDNKRTSGIKIASHTFDSFGKKVSEYNYKKIRFVHIEGVRV